MRTSTKVLLGTIAVVGVWSASGVGTYVGTSDTRPGGEVGWYFTCTYFTPRRSFTINYSDASRALAGSQPFWELRRNCPLVIHQSHAIMNWRH